MKLSKAVRYTGTLVLQPRVDNLSEKAVFPDPAGVQIQTALPEDYRTPDVDWDAANLVWEIEDYDSLKIKAEALPSPAREAVLEMIENASDGDSVDVRTLARVVNVELHDGLSVRWARDDHKKAAARLKEIESLSVIDDDLDNELIDLREELDSDATWFGAEGYLAYAQESYNLMSQIEWLRAGKPDTGKTNTGVYTDLVYGLNLTGIRVTLELDGENVYAVLGRCKEAMRQAHVDRDTQAWFESKIKSAESYDEVIEFVQDLFLVNGATRPSSRKVKTPASTPPVSL